MEKVSQLILALAQKILYLIIILIIDNIILLHKDKDILIHIDLRYQPNIIINKDILNKEYK